MTFNEMKEELDKLCNFYKSEQSVDELKVWYENLKELPIGRFKLIVAESYKKFRFMPKLSELWDLHKELPYTKPEVKEDIKANCKICGNSGCVIYSKLINGIEYDFTSVCECGRKEAYNGQNLNDDSKKNNYIMYNSKQVNYKKTGEMTKEQLTETINKLKLLGIVNGKMLESARKLYKRL